MIVADLKLRFVALVVIVGELETVQEQILWIFTEEQSTRDRCDTKRTRVRVRNESVKSVNVSRLEPELFARDSSGRDRDRKDHARFKKLILVGEVLDSFLIDSQVQSEELREQLLRARFESILFVGQDRLHRRDSLQHCNRRQRCRC